MYNIDKEYDLIDYLQKKGLAKNKVKTYIKLGFIFVNNNKITKLPYTLYKDDKLEIKKSEKVPNDLKIIYEDTNYRSPRICGL